MKSLPASSEPQTTLTFWDLPVFKNNFPPVESTQISYCMFVLKKKTCRCVDIVTLFSSFKLENMNRPISFISVKKKHVIF